MVIYGWLKVAFGLFCLGKTCCRHLLTGGMFTILQRFKLASLPDIISQQLQVLHVLLYV